jgi:hypothetical protein
MNDNACFLFISLFYTLVSSSAIPKEPRFFSRFNHIIFHHFGYDLVTCLKTFFAILSLSDNNIWRRIQPCR